MPQKQVGAGRPLEFHSGWRQQGRLAHQQRSRHHSALLSGLLHPGRPHEEHRQNLSQDCQNIPKRKQRGHYCHPGQRIPPPQLGHGGGATQKPHLQRKNKYFRYYYFPDHFTGHWLSGWCTNVTNSAVWLCKKSFKQRVFEILNINRGVHRQWSPLVWEPEVDRRVPQIYAHQTLQQPVALQVHRENIHTRRPQDRQVPQTSHRQQHEDQSVHQQVIKRLGEEEQHPCWRTRQKRSQGWGLSFSPEPTPNRS